MGRHVHGGGDLRPVEFPFLLLPRQTEGRRRRGGCELRLTATAHQTHHLLGCRDGENRREQVVIIQRSDEDPAEGGTYKSGRGETE